MALSSDKDHKLPDDKKKCEHKVHFKIDYIHTESWIISCFSRLGFSPIDDFSDKDANSSFSFLPFSQLFDVT